MVEMKGITCCGDCVHYNWKKHKCSRGFNKEIDARSHFYDDCDLPKVKPIDEWISVKDRLPVSGKRVVVCTDIKGILTGKWLGGVGCWINERRDVIHVTHWMPLPEPPKGE